MRADTVRDLCLAERRATAADALAGGGAGAVEAIVRELTDASSPVDRRHVAPVLRRIGATALEPGSGPLSRQAAVRRGSGSVPRSCVSAKSPWAGTPPRRRIPHRYCADRRSGGSGYCDEPGPSVPTGAYRI
ncbi:hypothetical protein [Streptomyces sp. NPDC057748]|uniref:hypothetical protein n=1 Tax=unclassified Streptomyces TaxID=2593676 RepID=UPI003684AA27